MRPQRAAHDGPLVGVVGVEHEPVLGSKALHGHVLLSTATPEASEENEVEETEQAEHAHEIGEHEMDWKRRILNKSLLMLSLKRNDNLPFSGEIG